MHRRRLAGRSGRARSPRGATPAWNCAGPPWPRPSSRLPAPGRPGARACRPARCPRSDAIRAEGDVSVRVVATSPDRTTFYRLELAALAAASDRIWLTDAYFMGTAVYIESLSAASRHGVDVRLLVPNNSDVPWVGNLSRTLLSPAARRRRPDLRVERPDDPRQDGGGRSAVRARRLDEPEPVELGGQLGARRRHRAWRAGGADGGNLRPRSAQRHRDRHHRAQYRPAAIGAAAPADGSRPPAAPTPGPRRQRQRQPHDQGRRAGGLCAGVGRAGLSRARPARSAVAGDDGRCWRRWSPWWLLPGPARSPTRSVRWPWWPRSRCSLAPGGHDADAADAAQIVSHRRTETLRGTEPDR